MGKFIDLTGQRFGRLIVLSRAENTKYARATWLCVCSCGNMTVVQSGVLKRDETRSCGCLTIESIRKRSTIHGESRGPTWNSWCSMRQRCNNPNHEAYKNYGGRGIVVCERWHKFENFLEDMGKRPAAHTLDRIDNNGNYEPDNCRWATRKEQSANKRNSRKV